MAPHSRLLPPTLWEVSSAPPTLADLLRSRSRPAARSPHLGQHARAGAEGPGEKNTKVNCVPTPHKQQLVRKPIPRPPSPTAEGQTRAAREARQLRKAHQLETGVELGPGEDMGFMPKVLTPPKKGVRWGMPLEAESRDPLPLDGQKAQGR
jgi:hypothetical protein